MSVKLGAVVVSLPERHRLLLEALGSVSRQIRQPDDVVVGVDPRRLGEVDNMNRLMAASRAAGMDAVSFLHDDDLWQADHLADAADALDDDRGDVIVSRFHLVGRDYITPWQEDWSTLRRTNWFPPSCVTVRLDVFGDWVPAEPPPEGAWQPAGPYIDWTNWRRLLDQGARFYDTGRRTCVYRFGEWGNGSWT